MLVLNIKEGGRLQIEHPLGPIVIQIWRRPTSDTVAKIAIDAPRAIVVRRLRDDGAPVREDAPTPTLPRSTP